MGVAREARESEKILTQIHTSMPSLIICLWYPLYDDALENIDYIESQLKRLREQILKEKEKEAKNGRIH